MKKLYVILFMLVGWNANAAEVDNVQIEKIVKDLAGSGVMEGESYHKLKLITDSLANAIDRQEKSAVKANCDGKLIEGEICGMDYDPLICGQDYERISVTNLQKNAAGNYIADVKFDEHFPVNHFRFVKHNNSFLLDGIECTDLKEKFNW